MLHAHRGVKSLRHSLSARAAAAEIKDPARPPIRSMAKECGKCGAVFARPWMLKRHEGRKTPCDLIVPPSVDESVRSCEHCNRVFSSQQSLYLHRHHRCKAAKGGGLGAAEAAQDARDARAAVARVEKQLGELTALIKAQGGDAAARAAEPVGVVVNVATQIVVNIRPWDAGACVALPRAQLGAAFRENSALSEYAGLMYQSMVDEKIAPPYVREILAEVVRRCHDDPAARNVCINPNRADQALVFATSGEWQATELTCAIRAMFDCAAKVMQETSLQNKPPDELPPLVAEALLMAALMYNGTPEQYVEESRGAMSAHLANLAHSARPPAGAARGKARRLLLG